MLICFFPLLLSLSSTIRFKFPHKVFAQFLTCYIFWTNTKYQTKIGWGGRITQRIFSHIGYKQFWHVQFYAWKTNTLKVSMFILGCYCKINLPWWTKYSCIQSLQCFVEELLNFYSQTFQKFVNQFFLITEWMKMCQLVIEPTFLLKIDHKRRQKLTGIWKYLFQKYY